MSSPALRLFPVAKAVPPVDAAYQSTTLPVGATPTNDATVALPQKL